MLEACPNTQMSDKSTKCNDLIGWWPSPRGYILLFAFPYPT